MSFIDYYPISTLPRIVDVDINLKVVTPPLASPNEQYIDIAISKSNISSYIIRPTPRLVWSYPISPSSVVECMDVQNHQNYVVGITDRKTYKLLCLNKDGELLQQSRVLKIIKYLKYIEDRILIVFEDGELVILNNVGEPIEVSDTIIPDNQVVYVAVDKVIIVIMKHNDQFDYRVYNLQGELINDFQESFAPSIFKYCDGYIYKYHNQTFYKMDLTFKITKVWNIGIDVESMIIANEDRLVVSSQTKLLLINLKYETLLDTLDVMDTNYLLNVAEIKTGINTLGLFLKLNTKKNKLTLNILNINVGLNNLATNLGKAFVRSKTDTYFELANLETVDLNSKPLHSHLLETLGNLKDPEKFQIEAFKYLKNYTGPLIYQTYNENDEIIDGNLVRAIYELIQESILEYSYLYNYLITHPLFHPENTIGLLEKLKPHPKLLKQCIASCPHLPIDDLLSILLDNVSKPLVNRICKHNLVDIIPNFQKLVQSRQVDVGSLIKDLVHIDNDNSWQLIKVIVDVCGLFNLSEDLVEMLLGLINTKLKVLELNNTNLVLLNSKSIAKSEKVLDYSIEKLSF